MNTQEINFIFKNEKEYRMIKDYYLLESNKDINNLGIQNKRYKSIELDIFTNKLENEEYKKACLICNALDDLYLSFSELEKQIFIRRFKRRETINYIANCLYVSVGTIDRYLKVIRDRFNNILKERTK